MAGNVVRQAGEQSSRLITKCTWHRDKTVSWRLWGVYQRAERMNIQRPQPLKGEKNILRFKSWRVGFKSASLGLCATGSGLTTTSTTDTGFIFFPPAEPRRLQTNFIYAAHFTPEGSTKGFTDDTDEKKSTTKIQKSRERNADRFKTRRKTNKYISYQRKETDSSLDLKAAQPHRCAVFQIYTHFFAMIRQMWLSNKQIRNIMEAV